MNERAVTPREMSKSVARLQPTVVGRDREFLPAALEILETPPPPLPVTMMLTICGFVLAGLVWSFFGQLDVHAVAPGKIETFGRAKVIQPLDPGKIAVMHVENGSHVKAGDLLLELDPAEAIADEKAQSDGLDASVAEVARRRFAINTVRAGQDLSGSTEDQGSILLSSLEAASVGVGSKIAWPSELPEEFRLREQAVLRADLSQLVNALKNLDKQMAQKDATRQRLRMSISYQDTLIDTLKQRVGTRQEAIDLKVGTKINLYDAKEQLEKSQSALASDQGQLIETDAALKEIQSEKIKATSQFIADNENKLAEASRKADEARQARAKAGARLSHTKLFSPIDGIVQQMAVTTVSQVVTTGQQLMLVTPNEGPLQVQALVANLDIGFVKLGQDAVVKVDAFPFTRFGVLSGKVIGIASEAVDEQEAKRSLANATSAVNSANAPAPSALGQPESFVFPVTVALDESAMKIDGAMITLTPGMTASIEIKTGSRRVIDYFLSPLAKVISESLRER